MNQRLTSQERAPHQRPWVGAACGAVLGTALATVCWAPASWLTRAVAQASQGQVLMQSPRGSVWQGSAQLSLSGGAGSQDLQALPGRLAWTLSPKPWGLAISLQADCCMTQPMQLRISAGLAQWGLQVNDHQSQWPAEVLTGLGAPWNTLQVAGQLALRTQALQLHWSDGRLQWQGLAELSAHDMSSRLSTLRPMGSYQVQVMGTDHDTPRLQLSTLSGALQLSGQGQWLGDRLRFTGEASAAEGQEAALSNLLNLLGRRDGTRSLLSLG